MKRHQVLTGAVNPGNHCFSVGSIASFTFWAYGSGCDLVILGIDLQPIHIIPGHVRGYQLITCLDCSQFCGKIAVAYGREIVIYRPKLIQNDKDGIPVFTWREETALKLDQSVGHATVLSWASSGERLLVGCKEILLWQLKRSTVPMEAPRPNPKVQFSIEEIEEEDEETEESEDTAAPEDPPPDITWELAWSSGIQEKPCDVQFSPDDTLFASIARGETMIKVWHQRCMLPMDLFKGTASGGKPFENSLLSPSRFPKKREPQRLVCREKLDFTFTYLIHPKTVAGFSWRKGVPLLPNGSAPNVLISSCHDNMCRIWCETVTPESDVTKLATAQTTAFPKQTMGKKRMHPPGEKNSAAPVKKSVSAPAISHSNEASPELRLPDKSSLRLFRHFHIAATINPASDVPLLPSISATDACLESDEVGALVFTVHWLDNKHHHAMTHLNKLLHETMTEAKEERQTGMDVAEDDRASVHSHGSTSTSHSVRSTLSSSLKRPTGFPAQLPVWDSSKPESVDAYLSCLASPLSPEIQSDLGLSLSGNIYDLLRKAWQEQSDALFAIHPTDGSLLVWHVNYLDENRCGRIRQAQVSFSSRIPMAIPARDASTLSSRLVLYANHYSSHLAFSNLDTPDTSDQNGQDSTPSAEQLDREYLASNDHIAPSINLLSKHTDGSLNQWEISFSFDNDFSTISSLTHTSRFCGHRYHLSDIFCHPTLPLVLTTSHHRDQTPGAELPGSKVSSELILWRVDPVGALCHTGGVTELTRLSGPTVGDFSKAAWFPVLFPSWCLGAANTSPSSCFLSLHDSSLCIYQAVIDAEELLDRLETPMVACQPDCQRIGYIASRQSSSQPGCVLLLETLQLADKVKPADILLLTVFPESQFSASSDAVPPGVSPRSTPKRGHTVMETFYVVLLLKSNSGLGGRSKIIATTWKISFSANLNLVTGARARRGTAVIVSSTSSDEESEDTAEHVSESQNSRLSYLNVTIVKMTPKTLQLPPGDDIVLACAAHDPFALSVFRQSQPLPFALLTTSERGNVYFWCGEKSSDFKNSETIEWKLMPGNKGETDSTGLRIEIGETPLVLKMAHCCMLACLSVTGDSCYVSVYECMSSGGAKWCLQDKILISTEGKVFPDRVHLDWLSREDGKFLLSVNVGRKVKIFTQSPVGMCWEDMAGSKVKTEDKNDKVRPSIRPLLKRQSTLDVMMRQKIFRPLKGFDAEDRGQSDQLLHWSLLSEIGIGNSAALSSTLCTDKNTPQPVMVSWVRDGLLLVATETEMHIFCHWMEQLQQNNGVGSTSHNGLFYGSASLSQSTPEGLCQYLLQEPNNPEFPSGAPVVSLMSVADFLSPCLPQYHPLVLSELTNGGHLNTVKHILVNLAVAISTQFEPIDGTIQEEPLNLKKLGLATEDADKNEECKKCLAPLLLHDLLDEDGRINEKLSHTVTSSPEKAKSSTLASVSHQSKAQDKLEYDDLFATSATVEDSALNLILDDAPNVSSSEAIDLSKYGPGDLGSEHCLVLHNYLSRNLLPGLTSLDQMELMAIADTVANSVHTERTSDVNVPSGTGVDRGGRGYASSGNKATESMDQCGLRFVFAMHNHLCLLRSLPAPQRATLLNQGLGSCHFAWAFHSDAEEEMLSLISSVQRGAPEWVELRSFGAGWWIRSTATLRRLIEQTARAAFQKDNNPLDAAIFYMALNKKNVLKGLFRSVHDDRMTSFFAQDFAEDRWHRAALKNAFALMGKQRFCEAAAFFLLANSVEDAVEICIDKMKDLQLASIIVRLYDQERSTSTHAEFLWRHVLGKSKAGKILQDPFVRSIAYWQLGSYDDALKTLLENRNNARSNNAKDSGINITDVFNFYNFLRSHPLIMRQRKIDQSQAVSGTEQQVEEGISPEERILFFSTAASHLDAGCPLLTLDVLSSLPLLREENASEDQADGPNASSQATLLFDVPEMPEEKHSKADWGVSSFDAGINDELELDWSESEESESEKIEDRPRVQLAAPTPVKKEMETVTTPQKTEPKKTKALYSDVYAHQLRLMACLKIFVSELKSMATLCHSDGGQIRDQLHAWLEKETEVLLRISPHSNEKILSAKLVRCVPGLDTDPGQRSEFSSGSESDGGKKVEIRIHDGESPVERGLKPVPSLHELYLAEKQDWKIRREVAWHRRRWLRQYRRFLRTLLSYSSLHDDARGSLAPLSMEILLLLQDSLQEKNPQQLSCPVPNPTSVPLLTSSVVACRTVVAEPTARLTHMAHDILATVLELSDPPPYYVRAGTQSPTVIACRQAEALAACIYQSLCDTNSKAYRARLLDKPGSFDSFRLPGSVSSLPQSDHQYVLPSTLPSQWPGVVSLQALLNSESSDNRPRLIVLLCESLVAVYVSLLVHGLQTCNSLLLYRLVNNSLSEKTWNAAFGGGTRVSVKYARPSTAGSPSRGMGGDKVRERLNRKVLHHSHERRDSYSSFQSLDGTSYREKYVAPETTLWDFFLTKPLVNLNGTEEMQFESDDDTDGSVSDVFSEDEEDVFGDARIDTKVTEHGDPNSYSWHILRLATVRSVLHNLKSFLPVAGLEISELGISSPLLNSIIELLNHWQIVLAKELEAFSEPPADFIKGIQNFGTSFRGRPASLRHQAMLDPNNTPFSGASVEALAAKRYWHCLVRRENLEELFVRYIFHKTTPNEKPRGHQPNVERHETEFDLSSSVSNAQRKKNVQRKKLEKRRATIAIMSPDSGNSGAQQFFPGDPRRGLGLMDGRLGKVKILHKETEIVSSFCINNANPNYVVLATSRDVQEIDVSVLLSCETWSLIEEDLSPNLLQEELQKPSTQKDEEFLVVSRKPSMFVPSTPSPHVPTATLSGSVQTGQGATMLLKRTFSGVRRMTSHPTLPYYLTGHHDGSVRMWEWGHQQQISVFRSTGQFPKVTNLHFSSLGNKIAAVDADGFLALWQVSSPRKPFLYHQCHDRSASDCCFMSSTSVVATTGLSSTNRNVAIWDTLLPPRSMLVKDFAVHEGVGATCVTYAARSRTLVVGGRDGKVSVFDLRRSDDPLHCYSAHEAPIKCIALSPDEKLFVTGAIAGDVRVWDSSTHSIVYNLAGEHARTSIFRNFGSGTMKVEIASPGDRVFSCGADGTLKLRILPHGENENLGFGYSLGGHIQKLTLRKQVVKLANAVRQQCLAY